MLRAMSWLALLSCFVMNAAFAAPPSRVQAEYSVSLEGIDVAQISETYVRSGDSYRIESVSKAVGVLAMFKPETIHILSEGSITPQGLHPQRVVQQRTRQTERNSSAEFDWKRQHLAMTDRNGTRTVDLPEGTQDRLSAMYQFMFLALQGKSSLDFYMTNGSKLDIYNYQLTPDQHIEVPLGEFKTLYVTTPQQPNGAKTEIWLATEHSNIPAKMVVTEGNGNRYTQVLTQLTITP
ncbi:MAG: DUF3108 domain-containing protein [Nitrosomonadales bacterium]|nr:DUF3108 domain-containing protein [Nitrosomonadales bacterium]